MAHKTGNIGNGGRTEAPLSANVRIALEWFVQHVLSGPPRRISCEGRETFYLFFDGACSESNPDEASSGTSVGAVLANNLDM